MSFLKGLLGGDDGDDEREAVRKASEASLEAGGLPLAAERRLRELRDAPGSLFTSDLSVNEWALLEREGIVPVSQVMGSSLFKTGWRTLPQSNWSGGLFSGSNGFIQEMPQLSDAFNGARERALGRLRQEAQLAGADAVVGVRLNTGGRGWLDADSVEFTAIGTAVRVPEALRTPEPVTSDLSGQEYWQLASEGLRPAGVVGITTVVYIASSYRQNRVTASSGWFSAPNQELPEFTQGFYDARELALGHLNAQAARLGANGIVGVRFEQAVQEREYERNNRTQRDLIVTVHVLGTAITDGHAPLQRSDPLTILPLGGPRHGRSA
jgi:uncharacterized protein YbjQ (UPF0145 family)